MALDLTPLRLDWAPVTTGDTYPACTITETEADTDLERVRITIKATGSDTAALELDSDATGITINTATAGAWSFTIDVIEVSLAAGFYQYDLETTDAAGTVRTEFSGQWEILTQITD